MSDGLEESRRRVFQMEFNEMLAWRDQAIQKKDIRTVARWTKFLIIHGLNIPLPESQIIPLLNSLEVLEPEVRDGMSPKARQKAIPHEKKMRDLVARIDQQDETQPKKTMKLLRVAAEEASEAQLEFQAYLLLKRCWDLEKLTHS